MPAVLLWIIANPTSGHGSGRSQVEKLCRAIHLSTSFSASASTDTANKERIEVHAPKEWSATQFNKLLRWDSDGSSAATNGASPLFDETLWASLSALFGVSKDVWVNAFTPDGLKDDSVTQLCTAVVLTETSQDGMRIAQLVGSAAQRSRCHGPYGGATSGERLIHLVATVGGDGTLSEVVNGLSNGVLAACGQNSCLNETGTSTFFGIQRERALLRHLLPPLIYIPGGTGADFAKLNLCCRTTDEFLTVLFGATSQLVSASFQTSPNFPSFATYEVDIGRITFPKTGRSHFFINECSIGMSCDVIERGEAYKTNPILSALGGTAIFASASFVSLLHMRPHLIRMARLPPPPQLPSDLLPPATTPTEPMTDNRGPSFLVDVQTRIAENLHQPQVVDAWTAPPVGDAGVALQQDLSALMGIRLSVEQQNQRSGLDPHEYYHYYQDASELPVFHPSAASGATEAVEVSPRTARQLYTQPSRAAVMGKRSGIVAEDAAPRVLKPAEVRGALDSSTICRQGHSATSQLVDWAYFMSSTVAFGNGRWYGGGMHVTPHADPTDGLVSCTNWVATFLPFVFGATALYNGRHVRWRNTSTWDGARFLVDVGPSAKPGDSGNRERMFMEADGELLEELPAVVEMGGSIVFLSPTQARFGQPLPGTARATTQLDRSSPTEDDSSPSTRRRWCGRLSSLFSRGRRQRE